MDERGKRYTAVIADSDPDALREIKNTLEGSGLFRVAAFAFSGGEAAEFVMRYRPDLVVAGLVMPGQDCFAMLEELAERGYSAPTRFVMTSAISKDFVLKRAGEFGVDYVFLKPLDRKAFLRRVIELMRVDAGAEKAGAGGWRGGPEPDKTARLLKLAGVPANLKGWRYLHDALRLVSEDFSRIERLTERVYLPVAQIHSATPQQVERAMRHAILRAFERADGAAAEALFGRTIRQDRGRPTNGEFIAALAARLAGEIETK